MAFPKHNSLKKKKIVPRLEQYFSAGVHMQPWGRIGHAGGEILKKGELGVNYTYRQVGR